MDASPSGAAAAAAGAEAERAEAETPAMEGPAQRLMIQRIELENFKSWGGIKSIGPFHKSFSAIVGPNGSGKSNVIDAMLFVFGFRASKLRLKKASELIHRSAGMPNCQQARVSVHFQMIVDDEEAERGFSVVEGSEFEVARIVRRDDSSCYKIDGRTVKKAAVTDRLKSFGIDLDHNRFLILQGEVEQISTMKAKGQKEGEEGLLEYLEDIIGSNRHISSIEEAYKRVEQLQDERTEALNRVKVVQNEKAGLEGAKLEAEACLKKELALDRERAVLQQVEASRWAAKQVAAAEGMESFKGKLAHEQAKEKEAKASGQQVDASLKAATAEVEAAEQAVEGARGAFADFDKRYTKAAADLSDAKKRSKALKQGIKAQARKRAEEQVKHSELLAAAPGLEEATAAAQAAIAAAQADVDARYEAAKGETAAIRDQLAAKEAEMAPLAQAKSAAGAALSKAETEEKLIRAKVEANARAVQRIERDMEDARKALAAQQKASEKAADDKAAATQRAQEASAELEAEQERLGALQAEAASVREALDESRAAQAAAQAATGGSRMHRALMQATGRGGALQGCALHGRLGDLGFIDAKYDVAVTTACGALQCLVVDTTEDAQRCVEHLRRNALGRARFIVLDKMGAVAKHMTVPCSPPNGSERLFDLVTAREDKFLPAFYFALRNTLVAGSLDDARKVAFGSGRGASAGAQWRVVTLQGEIIDMSGTMAGGGRQVRRGGLQTSEVAMRAAAKQAPKGSKAAAAAGGAADREAAARVAELEQQLTALSSSAMECKQTLSALEDEIRALRKRCAVLDTAERKAERARAAAEQRMADLQRRLVEAAGKEDSASDEDRARLDELQGELQGLRANHAAAEQAAAGVEAEVEALRGEVAAAGGPQLVAAKQALADAKEAAKQASKAVSKAASDAKRAEKNASKAADALAAAEKDLEAVRAEKERLAAEQEAIAEEGQGAQAAMQQAEEALVAATERRAALQQQWQELEKQMSVISSTIRSIQEALVESRTAERVARKESEKWAAALAATRDRYAEAVTDLDEEDEDEDDEEQDEDADEEDGGAAAGAGAGAGGRTPRELPTLAEEQLAAFGEGALQDVRGSIAMLEAQLNELNKDVDRKAIAEYREKQEQFRAKAAVLETAREAWEAARRDYDALRKARLDEFMAGFSKISLRLKEMYRMITLGGDADLDLVDSLDPFSEGIRFSVRPPNKSWKQIINLSGGEKTLASLSLVFALHHFKPTPLYVMDEIDAALDFKNVSIVGNYIKERTKNAQFIIISLRNNMFELADRLVGIYKTEDVTKSVTINPKEFTVPVRAAQAKGGGRAGRRRAPAALADRSNEPSD